MKASVLALLLVAATAPAAGLVRALEPTLVLYPVVELPVVVAGAASPTIAVSRLARVVAPRAEREALRAASVPVSALEGRGRLDKAEMAALLHAVPGLEEFAVVGPASVRVQAQPSPQRSALMLDEAGAFLHQYAAAAWPDRYRNLSFVFVGKQGAVPLGADAQWRFDAAGLAQLRRRTPVWLVLDDAGKTERLPLWFKVGGEVRAWNAIDDLPGHTIAGENLFAEGWADIAQVDPAALAAPAPDQQLSVALKAGDILVARHLERAPAVQFGADALVVSRAGGIEITATATALRTGFVGDTIALKARSSEEEFDAVVTGQNRVEIVQGGSR